ncbi:GNAT family N-acetyltransferase [Sulfitobacter sp. LCG007]
MDPLFEAIEATWPPARSWREGAWTLRDGAGGGKRVSAASAAGEVTADQIPMAETAMRAQGIAPLFMVRDGETGLDSLLEARGYRVVDPVFIYTLPIEALTDVPIPRVTTFCIWEPLAIMAEIWAQGGVGPERLAVMARTADKTAIFARANERPAGVGFAALHGGICMVHAVEILPHQRRQGMGRWIMRQAAFWGASQGAETLAVLCTRANAPANALYSALGFTVARQYHYRQLRD